jgi:hypothetical protein
MEEWNMKEGKEMEKAGETDRGMPIFARSECLM